MIFGFGRVGRMVADMLIAHKRPYLAIDSDVDGVRNAREAGYDVLFGDVSPARTRRQAAARPCRAPWS